VVIGVKNSFLIHEWLGAIVKYSFRNIFSMYIMGARSRRRDSKQWELQGKE
jgi:hypothetical protein